MAFIDFVKDEKNLVMFALVLIIILGLISYNLYYSSNMDGKVMNMDVLIPLEIYLMLFLLLGK